MAYNRRTMAYNLGSIWGRSRVSLASVWGPSGLGLPGCGCLGVREKGAPFPLGPSARLQVMIHECVVLQGICVRSWGKPKAAHAGREVTVRKVDSHSSGRRYFEVPTSSAIKEQYDAYVCFRPGQHWWGPMSSCFTTTNRRIRST